MAPFGKIYSYPGNWRVQRAQVVAGINGLEVTTAEDFQMGVTNKTPEFLAKFPLGKVPALECADGFCLSESAAIAAYLAGRGPAAEQLLGPLSEPHTRARIFEWGCFAESEVVPNVMPAFVMAILKVVPFNEKLYDYHAGALTRAAGRLEQAVQGGKKFLVGDKLTLADVMVACPLFFASGFLFDAEMRKDVPETVRYLEGLAALPEFSKVFGELKMTETRSKP